jgi:signal transduction histidine kinase
MSVRAQDLVVPVLAAGAVAALIRTRATQSAEGRRGRLRELAWCAALLVLSMVVASTVYPLFRYRSLSWWLVVPIVAALIVILRPRLAARVVPVALILYGLSGFVVARDYAFGGGVVNNYGLTNVSSQADLILPQAYAFLLLGGWLALRSADPLLVMARLGLGPVAAAPLGEQLRTFALLPVITIVAGLLAPRLWLIGGAGLLVTVAVVCAALLVIRRRRHRAAQLATAGLLCLGIAGVVIAAAWHSASSPLPMSAAAKAAYVQSAKPAAPQPVRPPSVQIAPVTAPAVSTPRPAADVADIADGQALPFGAVLVSSQASADAAAVEGLTFLALGAWLAPQTFPRVRRMLRGASEAELSKRVERLTQSRAVAVDTASADLRRLERDLHDGAQARLVALGMNLRAAERLIPTSPDAALALVAEARETSARALTELRELVRGVHPPVLADRGLGDAVKALALDSPMHVQTDIDLPGRLPAPVETACYFAVAELLTNAAKHSGARDARITMSHADRLLRIEVTDFGLGGADPALGSGLVGVEKRLATFDGILAVSSPVGGPTMVVMEVPCALSSPKTSSC